MANSTATLHESNLRTIAELFQRLELLELLLVRHANTNPPVGEGKDADSRRELSELGQEQLFAVGPSQCAKAGSNYFGKLLNVGYILHSPVGRCKTTARLVFTEHCRSINGNAPIQPVQRLYPPNAAKFQGSAPEFAAAVAVCEAAFDRLGYVPLRRYWEAAEVKDALRTYAVHAWHEILQILFPRLPDNQRDFDPVQVPIFGHAVFTQALAVYLAEACHYPAAQQAAFVDCTLDELDVLVCARRSGKHVKATAP